MRVLVTGILGFTGRYVEQEFATAGHHVIDLQSDLRDADALAKEIADQAPDAVVHLAAQAFVGHGQSKDFYEINVIGTDNLLAAIASHAPDIKSILLASSANVYGNRSEGAMDENQTPAPTNHYAISKLSMEHLAHQYFDRLPVFITRPFNYTGAGQDEMFLVPKIVKHFRDRAPAIELGNVDVFRDFGDVRAVAGIYRRLLEFCPAGETINICTGRPQSLLGIIKLCEEISGHKLDIKVNPDFVRKNEVKTLIGDNSKLRNIIGNWESPTFHNTLSWMLNSDR